MVQINKLVSHFMRSHTTFSRVVIELPKDISYTHFVDINENVFSDELRGEFAHISELLVSADGQHEVNQILGTLSHAISKFDEDPEDPNSDFNQMFLNPFLTFLVLTHAHTPSEYHEITSIESDLYNVKKKKHHNVNINSKEDLESLNAIFKKAAQNPENIFEFMFEFYDEMCRVLSSKAENLQPEDVATMSLDFHTKRYRNNVTELAARRLT